MALIAFLEIPYPRVRSGFATRTGSASVKIVRLRVTEVICPPSAAHV